jgi:ABC-type transporter Mla subunit MlaD
VERKKSAKQQSFEESLKAIETEERAAAEKQSILVKAIKAEAKADADAAAFIAQKQEKLPGDVSDSEAALRLYHSVIKDSFFKIAQVSLQAVFTVQKKSSVGQERFLEKSSQSGNRDLQRTAPPSLGPF